MKLGLAVLPMEVWADVFEYPCKSRRELVDFVERTNDREFAKKLQKILHGCGKQSLRFLQISSKLSDKFLNSSSKFLRKTKIPDCRQASLVVAPLPYYSGEDKNKNCEFPEDEMPENIKKFKRISISYVDDLVLDFLAKLKPIFTNVFLDIRSMKSAPNMRTLFTHLLPMLASIRAIACNHIGFELLAEHFPGTLAMAKELDLYTAKPAFIPACLNWLSAPLGGHGPRFVKIAAGSKAIFALVDAIREQFLTATAQSTFVIFLQFNRAQRHLRAEEGTQQNTATNEQLAVRNAEFGKYPFSSIHYVEIMRYPIGAEDNMREWPKQRAFYENRQDYSYNWDVKAEQVIAVIGPSLKIGHITDEAEAMDQDGNEEQSACEEEEDEAGPSSSKKMKKE